MYAAGISTDGYTGFPTLTCRSPETAGSKPKVGACEHWKPELAMHIEIPQ